MANTQYCNGEAVGTHNNGTYMFRYCWKMDATLTLRQICLDSENSSQISTLAR